MWVCQRRAAECFWKSFQTAFHEVQDGQRRENVVVGLVFAVLCFTALTVVVTAAPPNNGMLFGPAGMVRMGATEIQRAALVRTCGINPQVLALQTSRNVDVSGFGLDRFEVTNRQYRVLYGRLGIGPQHRK